MLPGRHLPISPCNRAGFRLVLILALLVITWLTLTPSPGALTQSINDKLAHTLAFLVLAFLSHGSWPDQNFDWRFIVPLMAYGLLLELLQHFIPNRFFSLLDLIADWGGVLLYLALIPLVSRILKKQQSAG